MHQPLEFYWSRYVHTEKMESHSLAEYMALRHHRVKLDRPNRPPTPDPHTNQNGVQSVFLGASGAFQGVTAFIISTGEPKCWPVDLVLDRRRWWFPCCFRDVQWLLNHTNLFSLWSSLFGTTTTTMTTTAEVITLSQITNAKIIRSKRDFSDPAPDASDAGCLRMGFWVRWIIILIQLHCLIILVREEID